MEEEKNGPVGFLGCLALLIIFAASLYLSIIVLKHFWAVIFLSVPVLAFMYARNYLDLRNKIRGWSALAFLLLASLLVAGAAIWMIYDISPQETVEVKGELAESDSVNHLEGAEGVRGELKENPAREEALVSRVIDGDTIEVVFPDGKVERVRYIGVNTPELDQVFGKEARDYNQSLVSGKVVELERDVSDRDRYGRLLRYVYVDSLFINAALVREGYANCATYPPDVRYSSYFLQLEREARSEGRGLWSVRK